MSIMGDGVFSTTSASGPPTAQVPALGNGIGGVMWLLVLLLPRRTLQEPFERNPLDECYLSCPHPCTVPCKPACMTRFNGGLKGASLVLQFAAVGQKSEQRWNIRCLVHESINDGLISTWDECRIG